MIKYNVLHESVFCMSHVFCVFYTIVEVEEVPEVKEAELPIIPNYLSNPPFLYSKMDNKSDLILAQQPTQNGSGEHDEAANGSPEPQPQTQEPQKSQSLLCDDGPAPTASPAASQNSSTFSQSQSAEFIPVSEQNGVSPGPVLSHNHTVVNCTVPMDLSVEQHLVNHPDYPHAVAHNGNVLSPPLPSSSPGLAGGGSAASQVQAAVPAKANPTMSRQQSIPQQLSHSQAGGPMPTFQPFFFTSTFPVNVQGRSFSSLCIFWCLNSNIWIQVLQH